jgi:hypothetical protein
VKPTHRTLRCTKKEGKEKWVYCPMCFGMLESFFLPAFLDIFGIWHLNIKACLYLVTQVERKSKYSLL